MNAIISEASINQLAGNAVRSFKGRTMDERSHRVAVNAIKRCLSIDGYRDNTTLFEAASACIWNTGLAV